MKLVTFDLCGRDRLGAVVEGRVVDLNASLTTALFSFTLSWGELVYGLTFISSGVKKPLAVGVVAELVCGNVFFWGSLMAGALLASLPVVGIYAFFTGHFVSGLMAGATKY
jgi:multiple sugar transport system permease protein